MNLLQVRNRINELMARWVAELKGAASMSQTDPNIASEYILIPLLREVYDWPDLRNLNTESANYPGIDLADDNARVAIQVTSKRTLEKVKHTLSEFANDDFKLYERYDRLIIYILVEKQGSYSDTTFGKIIGGRFTFDKKRDILDYRDLLRVIQDFELDRAKRVLDILEAHFGDDDQPLSSSTSSAVDARFATALDLDTLGIGASQPVNLRNLREFMIEAFDTKELRALISYDQKLKKLTREFAPSDSISDLVDETIGWCERRSLIPYLVALVKQERG